MARLLLSWCAAATVGASALSPLACGSPFTAGTGSAGADAGNDAAATDGALGPDGTTAEGSAGDGSGETSAPPGSIVYVSTAIGADANDGTDRTKPKKTIAAALTRAQAIGAGAEVHVCKGLYPETMLTLSQSIPLLGAYDCTSWARTTTYGYPTFDATNLTVVENADASKQQATLVVGGAVSASAVVDGFVISGASTSTGATFGLQIVGTASPVVSNDVIGGGAGNGGNNVGSAGVQVLGGSPAIEDDGISGGTGTGNPGSVGLAVAAGATPVIHDDAITGGTGTASSITNDQAAVGVLVAASLTQTTALKNLVVAGTDKNGCIGSSAGILVYGTALAVDIESSAIQGGVGSGPSTYSAGVVIADASGTTRVLSDRIEGGQRTGTSSQTYGVYILQAAEADVHDCEVHAGQVAASSGAFTSGVFAAAGTSPSIVDDTIYAGAGTGSAISVAAGVTGVVVTDNLLAGGGPGASQLAIDMGACSGQLTTLDHTAFVNLDTLYACGGGIGAATIPAMVTALPGVPTAGDIEIASGTLCTDASTCVTDSACPAGPSSCLPSVFGPSWTSDDGVTGLFSGAPPVGDATAPLEGWTLPPNTWCALARGGAPVGGITQDLFGQTRDPSKPTIGAYEYTLVPCQ